MITDEQRQAAQQEHDAHQRQITALNAQIGRLMARRSEHERGVERTRLILDGIEPCRACKRHVKSPCHDRASFHENGPWDGSCRDALYPERVP